MSKELHEDVLKTQKDQKSQSFSFVIPTTKCNWKKLYLGHAWGNLQSQRVAEKTKIYH